jgi:putative ABC transport system permease protein
VENDMETYAFAKHLFYSITDCSDLEVVADESYDPEVKMLTEEKGEPYFLDRDHQDARELLDYTQRDASNFRLYWKYNYVYWTC